MFFFQRKKPNDKPKYFSFVPPYLEYERGGDCLDFCALSYRMNGSFSLFWMIVKKAAANQLIIFIN